MSVLSLIDWNEEWKRSRVEKHAPMHNPTYWDKRAPEFTRHVDGGDYISQFLGILKPEPHWSVLDIGCAAGTLAIPMAPSVRSITALDASPVMLSLLGERCREQGVDNIRIVHGKWEDDWEDLDIGVHDVAIASRSLIVDDLRESILKLQEHASKRVIVSTLVDDGPYDRLVFEAVGRKFRPGPDYIIVYNFLRQMGVYANVAFTVKSDDKLYDDLDDAVNSMRWMLQEMTAREEERLRNYLKSCLVETNSHWKLPYRRFVRWAVLWWETN